MRLSSVVILCVAVTLFAQSNPFLSGGGEPTCTAVQPDNSLWHSISQRSSSIQREMQRTIAESIDDINSGNSSRSLMIMLGASFLFGLVHALGPGHRKGILISFFLGENYAPLKGIAAGFLLAAVHALSAVMLVGGLFYFTSKPLSTSVNNTQNLLLTITWGIVLLIGLWMIIRGIRHRHRTGSKTGLRALILSGAVPCPGASAIMILAVAQKAFLLGAMAVISMSAGMGALLASVGILTIFFRKRMTRFLQEPAKSEILEKFLHILSGGFMVLFALFMLAGAVFH